MPGLTGLERPRRRLGARGLGADLRAALPGWVAGRVLTGFGWVGALVLTEWRAGGERSVQMIQGLFAWDGVFYRAIAEHGYQALDPAAARFHPLLPLVGPDGRWLVVVVNLAALAAGAAVHRLCRTVLGDADLARRAATLVAIAPPSFCLVWVYAEGLFLLLSALQLLALHRRRWSLAAAAGALATLARPTGVLLAVPAAVVAWRHRTWRPAPVLAVFTPAVAMAGWLWWVERALGDLTTPLRVQRELRDGTTLPPLRLLEGVGEMVLDPFGDGLHIPFAVALVALAWVAWVRLPRAWAWYAVASLVVILSAGNLNSIERYGLGTLPLVVAGASLAGGRWWRPTVVASSVMLVMMASLAWYGRYVP